MVERSAVDRLAPVRFWVGGLLNMNKRGESEIFWLMIFLIIFIVINAITSWIIGTNLKEINQWIVIIIISLVETVISKLIIELRKLMKGSRL